MEVIREDTRDVDEIMKLGIKKGAWSKTHRWLMCFTGDVCKDLKNIGVHKNNLESLPLFFVLNLSFRRIETVAVCRTLGQMTVSDFTVSRPKKRISFLGADVTLIETVVDLSAHIFEKGRT